MLNDFTGADQVYIACGYTDLRKGIDGLARLVQQQFGSVYQHAVPVLRTAARPYQGLVLGKRWLHPAVQATGAGRVSMAALRIRGEDANAAAVPLAHGGTANRAAESPPTGDGIDHSLSKEECPKTIENTGFLPRSVV